MTSDVATDANYLSDTIGVGKNRVISEVEYLNVLSARVHNVFVNHFNIYDFMTGYGLHLNIYIYIYMCSVVSIFI